MSRYESKHRQAKAIVEAAKNFINISFTVSERHQYRMSSIYYHGLYNNKSFTLPSIVKKRKDLSDTDEIDRSLKNLIGDTDLLCRSIEIKSRQYAAGKLVVLSRSDSLSISVGLIKAVVVRGSIVNLIVLRYSAAKLPSGAFESGPAKSALEIIDMNSLQDSYPLCKRGTDNKFIFVLHHHISFSFD